MTTINLCIYVVQTVLLKFYGHKGTGGNRKLIFPHPKKCGFKSKRKNGPQNVFVNNCMDSLFFLHTKEPF